MTTSGISDPVSSDLVEHLSKGDCVLFVSDELDGRSQSQLLATALVDRGLLHGACPLPTCGAQGRCAKPGQCVVPFHRAAQLYESLRGRHELVRCVRDLVEAEYPPQPVLPILRAVASLPARTVITTAYDGRLEECRPGWPSCATGASCASSATRTATSWPTR